MDEIKSLMDQSIDNIREELWALGDSIYDNPEVALHEVFASTLLEDWLEQHGFNVTRGLGTMSTAFRATYENGAGGPSIGLLCEYDALPGLGHACGHHLQGPCIIAAANAIKNANIDKPYKLVIYGTPAEENLAGKITMLEEGCFRDIDVALMMHGSPTTTCDIKSMANYHIDVVFEGKSSHAAINPDKGRSALDALLLTFQGIEFLREHVPEDSRMHYTVADTYNIPANVVPDKAKGSFILRSFNMYTLENIYCCIICAKQPKEQRCYYAGAVFTRCTMEQHSSPFGISGAYYSAYAYGSVFRKNYAAVYHPHPFTCALLTAVVTGKYIVHLIFKSTFALGEFPASAFRNLNMNIVRAGKSRIGMETAFVFASHIENRAELTKSRSIAYTPQCA